MKAVLRSGFLALAITAVAVPADGGEFEDGVAAYKAGEYGIALDFWRPLAKQGHVWAQFNLGIMFESGHGVYENHPEAANWYRKAAEQGYAKAQLKLGIFYALGQGVLEDIVSALMWIDVAASQGSLEAQEARELLVKLMTPDQIAEAQRMAREWLERHRR